MARTNSGAVQALLGSNYDGLADLKQYIDSATVIINRTVSAAASKQPTPITLTTAEQELMERWLACYLYCKYDPLYASKSTGGASASFINNPSIPERYLSGAINIDYSGMLKAIIMRQVASFAWLGKPPSDQIPVDERS